MISTTFDGQSVLLLNDAPDWGSPVGVTFDLVTQFEEGLTGREARRPHAATLRAKLKFRLTIQGTDAFTFKSTLRGYQTQPIIVPFWPLAETWANRANIAATGLKVAYRADWSYWELYTTVEPGWVLADDLVAPAFWGRLEDRELIWINATVAQFDVNFIETGSTTYALIPGSQTFQNGPNLSGYATQPRLWPTALDWREVPESFSVRIIREQLGFGRAPFETIYPQTNVREAQFRTITQSSAECWKLIRFFSDHGSGKAFWTPTWHSSVVMAADIGAGSTVLTVQSAVGIQAGDYLAFVQGTGIQAYARTTTIIDPTVNLNSAPGAFTAADGDETLGTTIGLLTTRGYIYELAQTIGVTTTTTRLTSYEADLTASGNTYTARRMDHGMVKQSLFLDRDEIEIRSEVIAGDPLVKLATVQAEAPVRLTIKSVDVSGSSGSNDTVLFTGDIIGLSVRGSKLTAKAVSAGTVFDRIYPRFRMQVGCNHALFSTGCGLSSAAWQFTATLSNPGSIGYPFTFDLTSLARTIGTVPTITAGWFSGGWVEFQSGASLSRRAIIDNTAPVSGALTITLARDPSPFPPPFSSVKLFPGCDGAKATCIDKFANYLNFGGHPLMPATNPSLVKVSQNVGGGKK
ncbi:phage BR0599 family protein [bacterium]|nr:phage BR0599 family protein [bacterium]